MVVGGGDWVAFKNKILNVVTGEAREHSPEFWCHSVLGFEWDTEAKCPRWRTFLGEAFGGDPEAQQFLQEWMGYCMTEATNLQKGVMLIGEKRSGKGTISHVLRKLVGDRSYAGLSFNTWVRSEYSKEPLIGKRVGVFADVRFKAGRAIGRVAFDAGGIGHESAELLLNITGEDTITIGRKYGCVARAACDESDGDIE
jgi:putative DNA primase/helicase